MLLAYAMEAERALLPEWNDDAFCSAVFLAAHHLAPDSVTLLGPGADEVRQTVVAPGEVARRLAEVPLPEVTAAALRSAVTGATDAARYWEEPDGEDLLAAAEPVRRELRRIAEHITRSPLSQWWTEPLATDDQWSVTWEDDGADFADSTAAERLRDWHARVVDEEIRAERERPTNPAANWSAEWWSIPPCSVRRGRCSTGRRRSCGSSRTAWAGHAPPLAG
ncbi:hypothetical protein [Speluncibacter jeojiensis]|uniref:hypothetical protein n=1 Tax=Speluncibacter jeojiensis TaxID=2710754 RepID=UPI00241074E0|nr:hypothetical protein [Rhodococcus sp. D2-41]